MKSTVPAGTKEVNRFWEEIIIDPARVDRKGSHQHDYVPAPEYNIPDLQEGRKQKLERSGKYVEGG